MSGAAARTGNYEKYQIKKIYDRNKWGGETKNTQIDIRDHHKNFGGLV